MVDSNDKQEQPESPAPLLPYSPEPELPSIVIVGRPNVGKSTLFNAILGNRRSIVGDEPGITRDRIVGDAAYEFRKYQLIDTGGIIPNDEELIPTQILKQARVALDKAVHIIFLIDGRTEITSADRDLAVMLKRLGKPVALAVNKIDSNKNEALLHGFHELGFEDIFPVSAEHRQGLDDLLTCVTQNIPVTEDEPLGLDKHKRIKVAIIGRPNVGKSTLLNAFTGSERSIVSPIAGTTRDTVDESVVEGGVEFMFMDTAGIRRKGKTKEMAEKLSVIMALRHIRMAHVVLIIVDASEGMVALDATIAGYAHEEGRAVIIVANKWDAVENKTRAKFEEEIRDDLKFLEYAQTAYISAKLNRGVKKLFSMIQIAYDSASYRVGTGALNRFATSLVLEPDVRIKYITQAGIRPPTFVVFTDKRNSLHFSAERNLVNRIRRAFGFKGTPIKIQSRYNPKKRR